MSKKEYWWVRYSYPSGGTNSDYQNDFVTDQHPFIWYHQKMTEITRYKYQLVDWKKITKEEYNLYKELKSTVEKSPCS